MNRYWMISVLVSAGLSLLTACGPAATPPTATLVPATLVAPTATPVPPTATVTPTATAVLTATVTPNVTLAPEALQEAIFVAAREDDLDAMKRHIAAGADINDRGELGVTVLGVAAIRGNAAMVKVLLDAGAKFNVTVFQYAVLHSNDNVAIVQAFLDHGADINEAPSAIPAHTALMNAGEKGYIEVGKLLLANGADINKVDTFNDPALNVAAFNGQLEFVKMLVGKGAELNIRGFGNRTAVGQALNAGYNDVADFLKAAGGTE